jgi:hypothetical protein
VKYFKKTERCKDTNIQTFFPSGAKAKVGRKCKKCDTVLSMYNIDKLCALCRTKQMKTE